MRWGVGGLLSTGEIQCEEGAFSNENFRNIMTHLNKLFRAVAATLAVLAATGTTMAQQIPDEFTGAWGTEETCTAFHRGDLYWRLDNDGTMTLVSSYDAPTEQCRIKSATIDGSFEATCSKGSTLRVSRGDESWLMQFGRPSDTMFLHKCTVDDLLGGIGVDPRNLDGDLGTARHITFTFGYAARAAGECGYQIDGQTTQSILGIARVAAQRYAVEANQLPPEKFAKRLAEQRVFDGAAAADYDMQIIPDFCFWTMKAYGDGGFTIDGLFKE